MTILSRQHALSPYLPDAWADALEALARIVPYGRWSIEDSLRSEALHLPYGTTVVVVSASSARVPEDAALLPTHASTSQRRSAVGA